MLPLNISTGALNGCLILIYRLMGTNKSRNCLFTSESVTEGHPDKVADQISDAILDACLAADPRSRVACETMVTGNRVILAGEASDPAGALDKAEAITRRVIEEMAETGYL